MHHLFLNLAYLFMAAALTVRHMFRLRLLLLASQASFITYACLVSNLEMTVWNTVFIAVNVSQVVRLWRESRPIELPEELERMHQLVFSIMSRREFLYFWETGIIREVNNTDLIREGEPQKELSLIIDGDVRVIKSGHEVAHLTAGHFIAEISFLTDEPASADVKAAGPVRYIGWDQEKLSALHQVNRDLMIKLQAILGKDLSNKLKVLTAAKAGKF
ncbi:cyclic nucleotide-binding domain-containing protein [bacterium]|nr:cyclic nucleotide-binding domain-containing protein [bacterium]